MFKPIFQICFMRFFHAPLRKGRLPRVFIYKVLCAVIVLGPAGILAQEPATTLDELRLVLEQGERITLTDSSGNSVTGKINRLAQDGLDLNVNDNVRTFTEKDIRQITRNKPESALNGFAIGAAVGFGATLPINLAVADSDETGLAVAGSAIWGLIGGGIGALVDAFVHEKQLVYFNPKSSVSWSIGPHYSDSPFRYQQIGGHISLVDSPSSSWSKSSKGIRVTVRF